jgi:quercetin dioxygenase-like cupin family protein
MECSSKYISITRFGQNNPAYKDKQKRICLSCKKEFNYDRGGLGAGRDRMFCSLACSHNIDVKSFTLNPKSGYPREWNEKLKKTIKERDNHECQLCSAKENSLHIHHIDYDKTNLEKENLITLCQKCHNATHCGRTFWEIIFSGMMSGSKLVKKTWGGEIHISNNNDYCLKYLVFFKHKQFSFHSHNLKRELWHCLHGRLECVLQKGEVKDYLIFKQGDKIQIERNVIHQLQAIRNSILVEVSTKDYPEDSIRLIEGVN